ncbi:MAG TPA: tRNA (adenosine(37)-N6)-dimethylallyltransferase MiaA, partial [Candidatus Saccharimonadales bacterium]|nr:tRNA (adenosine(37)-N6)-dimethylallyltransferase MiaA [Candidatus Saccharimonadales bacterium]
MESFANDPPLIFITGQTASGKSDLGMDLARRYGGEIVCVDSRTIYRGMDIGTAKPSGADRAAIPHHLLDIAEVNHPLTVHEFKLLADEAIAAIIARGKLPIVVGGAGLYSDAVLYGFEFAGPPDPERRASLSRLSVLELRQICEDRGIPLPLNEYNPRHLIRHIETHGQMGRAGIGYKNALTLGIEVAPDTLKSRIQERVRRMI